MRKLLSSLAVTAMGLSLGLTLAANSQEKSTKGQGILDVVVVDEAGKPIEGVLVAVPGYRSTTGLGGTCRFGLAPGRYAALITKPGYRGRRVNAGVRPDETTTIHVLLRKLMPGPSPPK